jgi:hypothetical protein
MLVLSFGPSPPLGPRALDATPASPGSPSIAVAFSPGSRCPGGHPAVSGGILLPDHKADLAGRQAGFSEGCTADPGRCSVDVLPPTLETQSRGLTDNAPPGLSEARKPWARMSRLRGPTLCWLTNSSSVPTSMDEFEPSSYKPLKLAQIILIIIFSFQLHPSPSPATELKLLVSLIIK